MSRYLDDLLPELSPGLGKSLLSKSSKQRNRGRNVAGFMFLKSLFDEKLSKNALQDIEDMERNATAQKAENALKFKKRSRIAVRYQNKLAEAQEKGISLLQHMKNLAGDSWLEEAQRRGIIPTAMNTPENKKLRDNYTEDVGTANYNELKQEYDNFEDGPQTLESFNSPLNNFIAGEKRKLLSTGNTELFGKLWSKIKGEEYNFDLAEYNAKADEIIQHPRYSNSKITRLEKELPTAYGDIELINRDSIYNWLQTNPIMKEKHMGNLSFPSIDNEINKLIEKEGVEAVTLDRVQRHFLDFPFDSPEYNNLIKAGNDLEEGQKVAFRKFEAEGLAWLNNEPSFADPLLQVLITKGPKYSKEIEQIRNLGLIPSELKVNQITAFIGARPEGAQLLEILGDNDPLKRMYIYKIDEIADKLVLDRKINEAEAITMATKFLLGEHQNSQTAGNLLESEMIGYDVDILREAEIDDDDLEKMFPIYMNQVREIKDSTSQKFKAQQIYDTFIKRLEDQQGDYDSKLGKLNEMNKLTARLVDQHPPSSFDENFKLKNREVREAMNKPDGVVTEISEAGWDIEALNDIPYIGRLTEALYNKKISLREIGFTLPTAYGSYQFIKWGVPKAIDKAGAVEVTKNLVSRIGQTAINKGWIDPKVEVPSKVTQPIKIDGKIQYEKVTEKVTRNKKINGKTQYEKHTKEVKYDSGPKKGKIKFKKGQYKTIQSGPNKGKRIPIKETVDVTRYKTIQSGPNKGKRIPLTEKVDVTKLSRKGQTNFKVGQKYLKSLGKTMWKNPIIGKTLYGKLFRAGTIALLLAPQEGEAAERLTISKVYQEMYKQEMESLGIKVIEGYDPYEPIEL